MRITEVKAYTAWAGWAHHLLVKVETDAGIFGLMPHNPLGPVGTSATAHLAAATPNFSWLEIRQSPVEQLGGSEADLYPRQSVIEGDRLILSDEPGLGVEVNESLLSEVGLGFKFTEKPRLRRRDGSHTNS